MSKKKRLCVICGKALPKGEYGNNPEPVKPFSSGVCCNDCNMNKVLPARLAALPKRPATIIPPKMDKVDVKEI